MIETDCLSMDEVVAIAVLNRAEVYDRFRVYEKVNRMTYYRILRGERSDAGSVHIVREVIREVIGLLSKSFT